MFRVSCVRELSELACLRADIDRLSGGVVMQRFGWFDAWIQAYAATHKPYVLVAYRDDAVCGILPLAKTTSVWTGDTIVFIGSGKVCSDDLGLLAAELDSHAIAAAFAEWLAESEDCEPWDHLDLDGIREDNDSMARFGETLCNLTGVIIEVKPGPNCWKASLEGGLEAYKTRLTKRARKLFREAEGCLDRCESTSEVAQSLEHAIAMVSKIEQLHQSRWKERGIEGCFTDTQFSKFLDLAIRSLWNDPWTSQVVSSTDSSDAVQRVQVAMIRIDGKPAAGSIGILDRSVLDMYLTGMNNEFAEVRPGWQLNASCIHRAIEQGITHIDFLRGDEEYKERLGGVPHVQQRWIIPSRRLSSQARNLVYRSAVQVKRWLKSFK